MTTTLQSYITATAGNAAHDLQPLVANETYRRAVDAELAARESAAAAAAAVTERTENLYTGVQPFAAAMTAIRAVAKRFPEAAAPLADAAKSVQAAMGLVAYNPPPLTAPAATSVRQPAVVNATGATPIAPPLRGAPPAPPAPPSMK